MTRPPCAAKNTMLQLDMEGQMKKLFPYKRIFESQGCGSVVEWFPRLCRAMGSENFTENMNWFSLFTAEELRATIDLRSSLFIFKYNSSLTF